MGKTKTEQPTVEKIKLFESMDNLWMVTNSQDFALAVLTLVEGADQSDARQFANQHVPNAAQVKKVTALLYDTLNERRWQQILPEAQPHRNLSEADRARELASVHRQVATAFGKKFIGVPRHTVGPLDPRKRAAYEERQARAREAALERARAGVADGTAPELKKLLDERVALDEKIANVRESIRLARDAEYAKQRSAQNSPHYTSASGMEGGLPA